jgi:membrane protease YdiL (CAAX protease family)
MKAFFLILYLLGIAFAEWSSSQINATGGLIIYLIIMFLLLCHASFTSLPAHQKLYFSLSLAPMIRILTLFMPLVPLPQVYRYLVIAIPLLVVVFLAIKILNIRPAEVGLSLNLRRIFIQIPVQGLVGLTGIALGLAEYYILSPESMIPVFTWQGIWLPALIFLITTGFTEELIFRGMIQRGSLEAIGPWGLVYAAAIFSALHISHLSWQQWGFAFLAGLFWGWLVKRTGSIYGVSLSHGINNICLYLVIPFFI